LNYPLGRCLRQARSGRGVTQENWGRPSGGTEDSC
jgi:hypothetical protein